MLEIKNLTGGYVNIPVLKDVSFEVGDGQLMKLLVSCVPMMVKSGLMT